MHEWLTAANVLFGAGLGAAFYILLSVQPYLSNRSYDPKYNAVYLLRGMTGIIAGLILGIALGSFIKAQLETDSKFPVTPGVLAILGGYATEAVQQVLQRLVDIMLAAIRGDNSAQAQAAAKEEQAKKLADVQKLMVAYERETDAEKKKALLDQIHAQLDPKPANG